MVGIINRLLFRMLIWWRIHKISCVSFTDMFGKDSFVFCPDIMGSIYTSGFPCTDMIGNNDTFVWSLISNDGKFWQFYFFLKKLKGVSDTICCSLHWYDGKKRHIFFNLELFRWEIIIFSVVHCTNTMRLMTYLFDNCTHMMLNDNKICRFFHCYERW